MLCSDLSGVMVTPLTSVPLVFIDTAGCGMNELETPDEESKGNEGGLSVRVLHVQYTITIQQTTTIIIMFLGDH